MKIRVAFFIFLFFLANIAQAQVKFRVKKLNADSLIALIPEKEGTEKIEALNLLSNVICRKDIDSSISLATRAIELSEKLEYQKGLADGYFNVGNGYFLLDSIEPTITNYFKAQRIYEDIEPTQEYANLLMQLGIVNYFTGKIEVSKPYNRQANRIYESINDTIGLFDASFGMGVYYHVHSPLYLDSVIYYCLKAKSFLDTVNDQNSLAYLYTEIGGAHRNKFYETGDTSYLYKGIAWDLKGLALTGINDDAKSHLYNGIMNLYDALNTDEGLDSCKAIVNRLKDLCDTCKYLNNVNINATVWLGWISYKRGEYDSALTTWKQCIDLIEAELSDFSINDFDEPINGYNNKQGLKFNKTFVYSYIYEIYHELGDFEKALEYYLLWREIGDEAYLERNQNLITWMGSDSENEKTKNRIAMLARDNELHKIKVKQSRIWLICLVGFLIIFVFVTLLYIRQRKIKSEHKIFVREQKLLYDLELKKVESKKLKELDILKSQFFANISHEFRTPLTLIMRPLEKVLSKIEDPQHKKDLDVARKYAGKLQHLINNLLTISKLESGKMQLRTSETDIVKLVNNYVQAFESLAKQKNIALNFTNESEKINAFVDREKFEQILNNLLSNAFKFTGDGGRIEVTVTPLLPSREDSAWVSPLKGELRGVSISISDTGCGISPEHIDHIFDRFYQIKQENNSFYEGTGIGLSLTKELVELHHGKIEVESEPRKGTTFTILLPLGEDHLKPEEIEVKKPEESKLQVFSEAVSETREGSSTITGNIMETSIKQAILLIVEDNSDMRTYIREYFESDYRIIEAVDGLDGFKKSTEHIPDIIISDVMMPNMDGNEFCKKIKTDERTSHIPVILLTARASFENKMEGLETGADDFITKPFDGEELQVRVKNLIEQQKRIRKLLEGKIQTSHSAIHIDFSDSGITSMDEQFLQKVIEILKENHTDPQFNISEFGMMIGLSVAQLNRKIRAMTGQSTADFIRTNRLTRAAELIKKKSATITEIAYDVGFSSPSYFSECFKNHFGKLPSEFNENT